MGAAQVPNRRGYRRIRALRPPGGEEDLRRVRMEDLCDRFSGIFDRQTRLTPVRIDGRRIPEFLGEVWHHHLQYLRIKPGRSRIVKIDSVHGGQKYEFSAMAESLDSRRN